MEQERGGLGNVGFLEITLRLRLRGYGEMEKEIKRKKAPSESGGDASGMRRIRRRTRKRRTNIRRSGRKGEEGGIRYDSESISSRNHPAEEFLALVGAGALDDLPGVILPGEEGQRPLEEHQEQGGWCVLLGTELEETERVGSSLPQAMAATRMRMMVSMRKRMGKNKTMRASTV